MPRALFTSGYHQSDLQKLCFDTEHLISSSLHPLSLSLCLSLSQADLLKMTNNAKTYNPEGSNAWWHADLMEKMSLKYISCGRQVGARKKEIINI